jgi:hypothetical protein
MGDPTAGDAARKEREREYQRKYRAANAERLREQRRAKYVANREEMLQRHREWYAANREKQIDYKRAYRAANLGEIKEKDRKRYQENREERLEKVRKHRLNNADEIRRKSRERRNANPQKHREQARKHTHGIDGAAVAAIWEAQQHNCYLCGRPLALDKAFVEHWHGCQTGHDPKTSCSFCRRGLAHHDCNILIAGAGDDPDLLRKIADNLEAANRSVQERQLNAPRQLMLEIETSERRS